MKTNLLFPTPIFSPLQTRRPTLRVPVFNVLGLSCQKQMERINARWVVAAMTNAKPVIPLLLWYSAIMQLPAKPMSLERLSVYPKAAVTKYVFAADPNPAATSFDDVRPESINDIHAKLNITRGVI